MKRISFFIQLASILLICGQSNGQGLDDSETFSSVDSDYEIAFHNSVNPPWGDLSKVESKSFRENLYRDHYFLTTNGISPGPGKVSYQNMMIFLNQVNAGVSRNFSISAGVTPFFLLGKHDFVPSSFLWASPSFSFPISSNGVSAIGASFHSIVDLGYHGGLAGLISAFGTFGNKDANFHLRIASTLNFEESGFVFGFGGMVRTGRNHFLLTEGYYVPQKNNKAFLGIFGGRVLFSRMALTYGAAFFADTSNGFIPIPIPIVGISVPIDFMKKKE